MTEKNLNPNQKAKKELVVENPSKKEVKDVVKKPKENKVEKKPVLKKSKPVVKKTEAFVNAISLPISTKDSIAICKFIKRKKIEKAINDLEQVLKYKKAIPMKGEIPHRKGKIMSGRYPKNSTEHFIKLLKTLSANANINGLDEPVITEAIPNLASRPFGRFGRTKKKRTHVKIVAKEKKLISKKKKGGKKQHGRKKNN